jgi:Icc protein
MRQSSGNSPTTVLAPFRLAQISDCHLPQSPDKPYRGLKADPGLRAVLAAVADWQPDAVLITGDLSEDASEASYERLAEKVGELGVPVCAIPGNHDLPARMLEYFPYGPYDGPFVFEASGWKLLLLNSARAGRVDGSVASDDLGVLAEALQDPGPALLALHHQPVAIGSPWIDKFMLADPGELLDWVAGNPQVKAVVWGHVHQAFEATVGSARFMSCPSTAANSLPGCERFSHDPAGPACRWLELYPDGRLESGILQLRHP